MTRESMKMMGMKEAAYWLSWFTYHVVVVLVVTVGIVYMLKDRIFPHSNKLLLYSFFSVFGISSFGYVVVVASLFKNPRLASICGSLLYFGTLFIDIIVS
jgi:hypothetical protein